MPTWKKVIVSGSRAILADVTASFTGSLTGALIGTSSWAQTSSWALTASFVTGSIFSGTNSALSSSYALTASYALTGGSGGTPSFTISASNGDTLFGASTDTLFFTGSNGLTASIFDNGSITTASFGLPTNANVTLGTVTASFTGSLTGALIGTSSWAQTSSWALNAVSSSTVQNSSANVQYLVFVQDNNANPTAEQLYTDGGLTYFPQTDILTVGNIAVNGGNITTTATTFNLLAGATTAINIGASSTNVAILGNLEVRGTTTTISSSNLIVSDRFILLASGSTQATDGGIVIQSGSNGDGFAYFLDAIPNSPRWGFTSSFLASNTTATPDEYVVTARSGALDPTTTPVYGGAGFGHGNIYVNGTGDIFIYS